MTKLCETCGDSLPHKFKGCVATKPKIPTEAETPPENLTVKQIMNMIRVILKDVLDTTESIYCEEDEVICIGTQFKMWNDSKGWMFYQKGMSSPYSSISIDNPIEFFPIIIGYMARKKLDTWLMTRYFCMS